MNSVLSNTSGMNRRMSGEEDAEAVTVVSTVRRQASAETACTARTAVYSDIRQSLEKGVVDNRTWTYLGMICVPTATVAGDAVLRMKPVRDVDSGARREVVILAELGVPNARKPATVRMI